MEGRPPLTFAGRLVVLIAIVIAIGGTAADFWWTHESLEGSYPLIAFAMPAFTVAGLFIGVSLAILRLLGIRFLNDREGE